MYVEEVETFINVINIHKIFSFAMFDYKRLSYCRVPRLSHSDIRLHFVEA
jgi:hypothetical protein